MYLFIASMNVCRWFFLLTRARARALIVKIKIYGYNFLDICLLEEIVEAEATKGLEKQATM